ncbi:FMN-dependent NADH-azoreductase [Cytobacillus firmus]|uniref:NADPH-dependent FMN reductase n=1 Tax=Cytobacillus firmus TaxID=1399 RepID=UPI00077C1B3C|nr:NADPH-dependent FMN reductase [Cytobacillus firmus]MBG9543469.1 FMN-dependent NADH-azoreductase [Cytobacillus firmus]MBG9550811.1 FMN-dependent NADH-azoreductase [Cytobacillus firmus]MBG9556289.1 FMN-dependent NADH-azoreductase [Cytobacillus firmus]MBG9576400.1 FMN-dependent NADH-azoreductase [Cytobacillus firmus]MEC1894557.1 NAD(P)H-dependent oxidoreductase [Cytobacillus firmus]
MKLTIINGSPRMKGRTGIASRYIARKYNAELIDLSFGEIPLYNGTEEQYGLPAVKKLRQQIADSDGVILASPEYHSAMSGALKNALDFLGSEQFAHKPVGLLVVAGGGKGGINALNNLRIAGRGVYANVIPKQLVLDPHCFDYENDGLFEEPAKLVDGLMNELQVYMKAYGQIKQELKQ